MQVARVPLLTIEEIERHNKRFFGREEDDIRTIHSISWDQICKPTTARGLGIKQLRGMNIALLAKLGWGMLKAHTTL